ncbi:DNA-protecting protein DprA [Candidatus Kaiserbacteria bacterium CG_4_9_14_0_2_um_filter_41_32]|uniref:DNA-protecting protein DprA n=1 Tax=Candidatus Kaiserbacteria bacterium CG_4_9_14_0_2_um_filter_41_32 TaxID=1974601 RepID=A0A2M8FF67_9BACT|nr:MAG: DNA-protecting protein DprA [Candidatus Kaiserbacteria bacterium CG_4_9_14_0_2_um_filter_41_32]
MNSFEIRLLEPTEFPPLLAEIPQPPKELWAVGTLPTSDLKLLAVVGSRKYTTYGKQVIEKIIGDLAGYPIGIISGLALGIDGLAHEAALSAGLYTLAVPGSGLNEHVLYPASHRRLGRQIVENGGGLLSELPPTTPAALWTFPQRNRIMAGMSHATLLIEAGEKSGTLITARMAIDYNRELLVVPGSIFSKNSLGTHQFLKLGATPVTTAEDILYALGIDHEATQKTKSFVSPADLSTEENQIIKLLFEPTDRDTLIRSLNLPSHLTNTLLMQMEIKGLIASDSNIYHNII